MVFNEKGNQVTGIISLPKGGGDEFWG